MKLKELSLRFLTFLTVLISAIVVLQMVPTTVSAATFTDGDGHQYIYSDNGDGTATITGFVKGGSDIAVIPDTIDDLTVTFIGDNAFEYKELTGVTLPSGLEYIGDNAFFCSQLTNITIPQSVVSIGDNAFVFQNNEEGEKTLTEVIFEEGSQLETIGDSAFRANRIQSLTIPDSVLTIGEDAFKENNISSLTIGENITSISEGAFSVNEIESLTIPESVTNIGSWAFEYNFLTEVETPTNVANIGNSAFYNNQLTSVAILNPGLIFRNNVFASNPEGLTIYGYRGSTAEAYAAENGHTFVALPYEWNFVDGNELLGLNKSTEMDAWYPEIAELDGEIYAVWFESSGSFDQIRVRRFDGTTWTFVDGDGETGLNYNTLKGAKYPDIEAYDGEIYVIWTEDADDFKSHIRIKRFEGEGWYTFDSLNKNPLPWQTCQSLQCITEDYMLYGKNAMLFIK